MTHVPTSDITAIDVAACTREGIAAAVESLRTDGVVILRRAVQPSLLTSVSEMVSGWHERFLAGEVENYSLGEETATVIPEIWEDAFTEPREVQGFRKWNVAELDRRIVPLVDAAPLYDVIHGFIGPDLMVTKTQMIVLPAGCLDSPFLHTDAGAMADIVESMDASPAMVSAQVFLTDLPEPGMGNFTCVPGSHKKRYPWSPDNPTRSQISGPLGQDVPMDIRRQVIAEAGDVAVFIHSLWHGVTTYSPSTARQRLLFGDLGGLGMAAGMLLPPPRRLPQDHGSFVGQIGEYRMSSPRAFQSVVSPQLDKQLWQELLDGRTGILRIPDFLPPARRRAALEQLDGGPFFAAYDPTDECGGIDPEAHRQIRDDLLAGSLPGETPVPRRLGRTLYEYSARGKPEEYFKHVAEFESERRSVFAGQDDIIDELLELVRASAAVPFLWPKN